MTSQKHTADQHSPLGHYKNTHEISTVLCDITKTHSRSAQSSVTLQKRTAHQHRPCRVRFKVQTSSSSLPQSCEPEPSSEKKNIYQNQFQGQKILSQEKILCIVPVFCKPGGEREKNNIHSLNHHHIHQSRRRVNAQLSILFLKLKTLSETGSITCEFSAQATVFHNQTTGKPSPPNHQPPFHLGGWGLNSSTTKLKLC